MNTTPSLSDALAEVDRVQALRPDYLPLGNNTSAVVDELAALRKLADAARATELEAMQQRAKGLFRHLTEVHAGSTITYLCPVCQAGLTSGSYQASAGHRPGCPWAVPA